MIDLDLKHYKMFCKIRRKRDLTSSSLTQEEKNICEYLMKNNCIKSNTTGHTDLRGNYQVFKSLPNKLELTEFGCAQIYSFRFKFHFWWIPIIVSVISSAISILISLVT